MGKRAKNKDASVEAASSGRCYTGFCLLLQVLAAVAVGTAWALVLWARQSHHLKFDREGRQEMDELQSPIADSAFYLSYYYDVARAPSLVEGLQRLLVDDRSEAPDVVNALEKFNVLPELAVNALHRLAGWGSPFGFYVSVLVCFTGLGCAALALTAGLLGGSPLCGVAACSLYAALCFGGQSVGTRLGGSSIALREHWGVPALLLQHIWVSALSAATPGSSPRLLLIMCAAGTCLLELTWQFAPFLLLLQLLAVLGAHTLGSLSRRRLGEVALSAVLGTVGALSLSFGNRMLLCSPFFALASSCSVVGLMPSLGKSRFLESAWVLTAALVLGAMAQQSLAKVASAQEDRHVMQLLLQKLGFAPPEASFDAFLYLQAPEFQFLQWDYVDQAREAWALPSAVCAAVLILAAWLRSKFQSAVSTSEPAWIMQVLFLIALILLAGLVSRLRVLAAPLLCIVGSQIGSPELWSSLLGPGRLRRAVALLLGHGFSLALIWAPLMRSFGDSGVIHRVKQVGAHSDDLDMRELVEWANETLQSETLLMADMTLAAKLRMISPSIRVGNHPQYESLTSRKRNRDYYRTFSCAPPHRVHEVLSSYRVTHVVLNLNACKARMGKLDAFMEAPDQCGARIGQEQLQRKTFCWGGFLTQAPNSSQGTPLFELAFRNPVYTVLRLAPPGTAAEEQKSRSWTATGTWKAWLEGLEGSRAARGIARAAVAWPKRQGAGTKKAQEVAELQLRRAEALAPDDPIVVLSRAEILQMQGQGPAAYDAMARAADLAAGTALSSSPSKTPQDPAALFQVFASWKGALNQRGAAATGILKNLAITLRAHLEATHNNFDMCDMASWLKDWGEQKASRKLWKLAKRDAFDQCVREDWLKWEGSELTEQQTWRAFLRL